MQIELSEVCEYPLETMAEKTAKAEEYNCDLVIADDHTLLLDLDTPDTQTQYKDRLTSMKPWLKVDKVTKWFSRNDNVHVQITLSEPLPLERRVALQAVLGSDPKREMVLLREIQETGSANIVLFRPRMS